MAGLPVKDNRVALHNVLPTPTLYLVCDRADPNAHVLECDYWSILENVKTEQKFLEVSDVSGMNGLVRQTTRMCQAHTCDKPHEATRGEQEDI